MSFFCYPAARSATARSVTAVRAQGSRRGVTVVAMAAASSKPRALVSVSDKAELSTLAKVSSTGRWDAAPRRHVSILEDANGYHALLQC